MTQYLITFSKVNDRLETETWFDQRPSHREVPALLVKAERIEKEISKKIDDLFDEAERNGTDPWPALYAVNPGKYEAIKWLTDLRAYYNGDQGAECDCVTPEQSCRYCKAMAAVSNYTFEEE